MNNANNLDVLEKVCWSFKKSLNIDNVNDDDDFYQLGGDSISVVQLISELKEYDIYLDVINKYRTPKNIANYINNNEKLNLSLKEGKLYPINDMGYYEYVLLKKNQGKFDNRLSQFSMTYLFYIEQIPAEALREGILKLTENHKMLKAKFVEIDNRPFLKRRDDWTPDIKIVQLDKKPDEEFFVNFNKPFNIFEDDLFRCQLFVYENSTYVYLDINHFLSDGYSHFNLLKNIVEQVSGQPMTPEKINSFDLLLMRDNYIQEHYDEDNKYYENLMQGKPFTKITFNENCKNNDPLYGSIKDSISKNAVRKFCKANNITPANFFLASLYKSLNEMYGIDDISLITYYHGRHNFCDDTENVGALYRCFPATYTIQQSESIINIAQKAQKQINESHSHIFNQKYFKIDKEIPILFNFAADFFQGASSTGDSLPIKTEVITLSLPLIANYNLGFTLRDILDEEYLLWVEYDKSKYTKSDIEPFANTLYKNIKESSSKQ